MVVLGVLPPSLGRQQAHTNRGCWLRAGRSIKQSFYYLFSSTQCFQSCFFSRKGYSMTVFNTIFNFIHSNQNRFLTKYVKLYSKLSRKILSICHFGASTDSF